MLWKAQLQPDPISIQPDHRLMTSLPLSVLRVSVTAAAILAGAAAASGQAATDRSPGFLDGLFGGGEPSAGAHRDRLAQSSAGELGVRIDRLEAQIRQMTGVIEELQFRNQQMADQLRRMQEDAGAQPSSPSRPPGAPVGAPANQRPVAPPPGRRGDAFDPTQNPAAPGAPRTLGALPGVGGVVAPKEPPDFSAADEPPPAAPGGRIAGEPLNLSNPNGNVGPDPGPPGGMPPAEGRNFGPGGAQVATLPPSDSPRDYYDLAYGYVLRKDYALAEDGFRTFLRKYPSDRMAPDAQYWLGESLFQRQRYRDAAEAFLNVSTKYESTAKAPDALLRLGQSLAMLGEKEAACASLGEVLRKYPRAALGVKQGVDREQKRVGC
jgi:tol-pal system protein YbgF